VGVSTISYLYASLAIVGTVALIWVATMVLFSRASEQVRDGVTSMRVRVTPYAVAGAWVVALAATLGSLYYSEVAHFEPCRLCWYQRIAMYPLVVILGIAAWRRDVEVRTYAIPVAAIGALLSGYHYLLEWFPQVDTGACTVGVPCTLVWFRELGFITLPYLALTAFLLVITLLLVPLRERTADRAPRAGTAELPVPD
jgi:disulfide bond formation protein DsbB